MSAPQRFRKKPVEIEAVQWDGTNRSEVAQFLGADHAGFAGFAAEKLLIRTMEHEAVPFTAQVGWWVIRGVQGEHYACAPDIFEATYEDAS